MSASCPPRASAVRRPGVTGNLIMEILPELKEYINNNCGSLPPITDLDEPLQIDSLGLIRLIAFLENEFGYRIEDEEMTADNFETLRHIGQLLATKTPTGPTPEAKLPRAGGSSGLASPD
jgi:acyl carrier protein